MLRIASFTVAAELALPEVDFASKKNGTSKEKRKQSKLCGYKDKAKTKRKIFVTDVTHRVVYCSGGACSA